MVNYFSGDDRTLRKFDFRKLFLDGCDTVTNSCDGLIGVYGTDSFYIVNPSIRKISGLPKGSAHVGVRSETPQIGLGFDASTGEYKVIQLFHREVDGYGCEVLSLGGSTTRSWWLVDDPPIEAYNLSLQNSSPVAVKGAIYWGLNSGFQSELLALLFGLGREKFDVLMHPQGSSRPWPCVSWVTELGGSLCVVGTVTYPDTISCPDASKYMNVWLLKKYKNGKCEWVKQHKIELNVWLLKNYMDGKCKWVKRYRIDLRKVRKPICYFYTLVKPLIIDDERIVLCCGQGRRDYYDDAIRFGMYLEIRNVYAEYVSPYDESL